MVRMIKSTSFVILALAAFASTAPLLGSPSDANGVEGENELRVPLAAVYSSCKNNKQVALTFDDGPWVYACVAILFLLFSSCLPHFILDFVPSVSFYHMAECSIERDSHDKNSSVHPYPSSSTLFSRLACLSLDSLARVLFFPRIRVVTNCVLIVISTRFFIFVLEIESPFMFTHSRS